MFLNFIKTNPFNSIDNVRITFQLRGVAFECDACAENFFSLTALIISEMSQQFWRENFTHLKFEFLITSEMVWNGGKILASL